MAEFKTYRLTISRTIKLTANIFIDAESPEDAETRFQHQLESDQCSAIEDDEMWGEAYYYQAVKAGPYASDYDVLEVGEDLA